MAMAMTTESSETSRFIDVFEEPVDHHLPSIKGYGDEPLISLIETVRPVSDLFDRIEVDVSTALNKCQNPADGLTEDESGAIYLYTMQFRPGPSLYHLLNQCLRAGDRDELTPWFSYLKLFLTALDKLPSQDKRVWRGVRDIDSRSKYRQGKKFTWSGVSSCTTDIGLLNSNKFLGQSGPRNLFSIDCINGKSISNHSQFKNEQEFLLIPGSSFEVVGTLNSADGLHIIHLKEIPAPVVHSNNHSSSMTKKHSFTSHLLSKMVTKFTSSNNQTHEMPLLPDTKWNQVGITVAGGNGSGYQLNQFNLPVGMYLGSDQMIYIADMGNHRIVTWKPNATEGQIIAGGNGEGNEINQFNCPTNVIVDGRNQSMIITDQDNKRVVRWSCENYLDREIRIPTISCFGLAMDKDGSLYVSDRENHQVRRLRRGERTGIIVAGGHGDGRHLNQLNWPTCIFVDKDYSLYVSDSWNHRVMKWFKDAKEGIVVAGGHGRGSRSTQLSYPHGVIVDQFGRIYVADKENHRVMCWREGAQEGTIVVGGGNDEESLGQLKAPVSLAFDQQGSLYVVEQWNHRVQKFEVDQNDTSELVVMAL